jgi:hypothetical protein
VQGPILPVFRFDGTLNDADMMLFVYRQEYYRLMRKPRESNREKFGERLAENGNVHARAEVIIG